MLVREARKVSRSRSKNLSMRNLRGTMIGVTTVVSITMIGVTVVLRRAKAKEEVAKEEREAGDSVGVTSWRSALVLI